LHESKYTGEHMIIQQKHSRQTNINFQVSVRV